MSFSTPGHYTHPYTNNNLHRVVENAHHGTILNAATNTGEEYHQQMDRERELEKQHRQREEDLINSFEAEEDRIVVMLSRKLEQVRSEFASSVPEADFPSTTCPKIVPTFPSPIHTAPRIKNRSRILFKMHSSTHE